MLQTKKRRECWAFVRRYSPAATHMLTGQTERVTTMHLISIRILIFFLIEKLKHTHLFCLAQMFSRFHLDVFAKWCAAIRQIQLEITHTAHTDTHPILSIWPIVAVTMMALAVCNTRADFICWSNSDYRCARRFFIENFFKWAFQPETDIQPASSSLTNYALWNGLWKENYERGLICLVRFKQF